MQLRSRSAFALLTVVSASLVPAAGASAAQLRGVVVHQNRPAHSFVLAGPHGRLSAVHAQSLPVVGHTVTISARQLHNGTWAAQRVRVGPATAHVRLRGTVTYVNRRGGTFVLSASGASVFVHEKTSRRNTVRLASDSGIREGEIVVVDGALRRDSFDASEVHGAGIQSSGISLEGTVQSIDPVARTLTVSADDDDQSGAAVVVQVPASFDLGAFTTGEPVELTVTGNPDGTYTLEGSSDDASAAAADNQDDMQGEDDGAHANAALQCAAQQADPTFVASHDGLTFTQVYERNPNDAANAFGRCVNLTAHQQESESPSDAGSELPGGDDAQSRSGSDG